MIDVIIPTKNSEATLGDCLTSLMLQQPSTNVILVDARSTNKTRLIAESFWVLIYDQNGNKIYERKSIK